MAWPKGVKRGPRKPVDESLPPEAQALVDEVIAQGIERPMQQDPQDQDPRVEAPKRTFSQPQSKWGRESGGMKAGDWGDTASNFNPSEENVDMFHIPEGELPGNGKYDFKWVTTSIYGKPTPEFLAQAEKNHWRIVYSQDFNGWGEEKFNCKKGQDVAVERENNVFVARPMEYSDKVRQADMRRAQEQANLKTSSLMSGQMPGVTGASHKSALNANKISKSWERVAVPSDD